MQLIILFLAIVGAIVMLPLALSVAACLLRAIFGLLFIGLAIFSVIWLLTAILAVF